MVNQSQHPTQVMVNMKERFVGDIRRVQIRQ